MSLSRAELDDLLLRLEKERAKVVAETEEVKRRIGLIDDVLSWNLIPTELITCDTA